MGEKRRYFSREFKRNAVQLVTEKRSRDYQLPLIINGTTNGGRPG